MTPSGHAPASASTYLVFDLAGRLCALPGAALSRVLPMVATAHPPGLPPLLQGLATVNGAAMPVVRLAALLDLPERAPTAATALVEMRTNSPWLLMVDRVVAVLSPGADELRPVPEGLTFSDVAVAGIDTPEGLCVVLDAERLLLREEEARIAAFLDAHHRRAGTG